MQGLVDNYLWPTVGHLKLIGRGTVPTFWAKLAAEGIGPYEFRVEK